MDSISSKNKKISFAFKITSANANELKEEWQYLLHITGDFSIQVDSKTLYSETEFCLVEFAQALSQWLKKVKMQEEDFIYRSLEAEEELIWIKKTVNGWQLGAYYETYREKQAISLVELIDASNRYLHALTIALHNEFQVDIKKIIS